MEYVYVILSLDAWPVMTYQNEEAASNTAALRLGPVAGTVSDGRTTAVKEPA